MLQKTINYNGYKIKMYKYASGYQFIVVNSKGLTYGDDYTEAVTYGDAITNAMYIIDLAISGDNAIIFN